MTIRGKELLQTSIIIMIFELYYHELIYAIFGGLFSYLLIFLSFVLAIFSFLKNKIKINVTGFLYWIPFFILGLLIIIHNGDFKSSNGSLFFSIYTVVSILIGFICVNENLNYEYIFKKIVHMGYLPMLFTYLFAFFNNLALKFNMIVYGDPLISYKAGIYSNYSKNGNILVISLLIIEASVACKILIGHKIKIYDIAELSMFFFALLITTKRMQSLIGIFAFLIIICCGLFWQRKHKQMFSLLGICIFITFVISFLYQKIPILYNLIIRFSEKNVDGHRFLIWRLAIKKFFEAPLIGHGWRSYQHFFYLESKLYLGANLFMDAHNSYIQMLFDLGIVGLSIIIYIGSVGFQKCLYNVKKQLVLGVTDSLYSYICCFLLFFYMFIYSITGTPFFDESIFLVILSLTYVIKKS